MGEPTADHNRVTLSDHHIAACVAYDDTASTLVHAIAGRPDNVDCGSTSHLKVNAP